MEQNSKQTKKQKFRKRAISSLISKKRNSKIIDSRINFFLKNYIFDKKVKSVLLYIPLETEVDIRPLIVTLRKRGIRVYVPFMEGESFRLVKYRLPLYKKRFGISEPKISNKYQKERIDLALVPIVGIDSTCRRIGFGKGMYDRFYERHGQQIRETVFIQRILCWSKEVLTDSHDIKADMIISSKSMDIYPI